MLARWVGICLGPLFVLGCALFDQPPPEPPPKAGRPAPSSRYEPLATLCQCAVTRAEEELRDALAFLDSNSSYRPGPDGFATCAGAMTGVPTLYSPMLAGPIRAHTSFAELDSMAEERGLGWQTWIEPRSSPLLEVNVWSVGKQRENDPDAAARKYAIKYEMRQRIQPVGRALTDAHLAAQLCHATALFIALEGAVGRDRSHVGVVRKTSNSARVGDGVAAAATGLVLTLKRAAARSGGDLDSRLARFKALGFEGEFESDADDVARLAARHAKELGGELARANQKHYSHDVALPLWLAPRPALVDLCQPPDPKNTSAARDGLEGLREGDLDRMMIGARSLYPKDGSASQGQSALCALIRGEDKRSLAAAREMVAGYSATGTLLTSLFKERTPR